MPDKTNMPLHLTVTSNGLFLLKSFEERGVQESDCFLRLF